MKGTTNGNGEKLLARGTCDDTKRRNKHWEGEEERKCEVWDGKGQENHAAAYAFRMQKTEKMKVEREGYSRW